VFERLSGSDSPAPSQDESRGRLRKEIGKTEDDPKNTVHRTDSLSFEAALNQSGLHGLQAAWVQSK